MEFLFFWILKNGGGGRNRTGVYGFAIRCITILLPRRAEGLPRAKKLKGKQDAFPEIWSGKRDSNSRPIPWQGIALPTELFPQKTKPALYGYCSMCQENTGQKPA